jgi:glycosyltransferase involved in cell wall biosynthesis
VTTDLVSIAIVAYNNWPDLELAIQSALCQSYRPIEVIVVDNSSTDATPQEVPKRFGDRVRYSRQPNSGDAGGYNAGMRLARGEYVQLLDGDDVLTPYKVEKQMEVFRADPGVDIVYGNVRQFQTLAGQPHWMDWESRSYDDMLAASLAPNGICVGMPIGCLFRRQALERIGAWDENIYVCDADYELRAIRAGCRFKFCPGVLMGLARIRPGQMSANAACMLRGNEALWSKALTYIVEEPYRSMIQANLARGRYFMAVRKDNMTLSEALAKLTEARATSGRAVPLLAYLIGFMVIVIPGGRFLASASQFRTIRRAIAKLVGYQIPS